jgi:hypothetical protein
MIHIRSFFDLPPEAGRKGKAFSIANSTPNRVKVDGTIECLVPPWSLVRDFKAQKIDWEGYTDHYREYLRENRQPVKAWLQSLNNAERGGGTPPPLKPLPPSRNSESQKPEIQNQENRRTQRNPAMRFRAAGLYLPREAQRS